MKKLYPFLQILKPLRFLYVSALCTSNKGYLDDYYTQPYLMTLKAKHHAINLKKFA